MTIRELSTRDQLRELGNATAAGLFGAFVGLLLGFGDLGGVVWYDLRAGFVLAVALFAVFFCAAIFCAIVDPDDTFQKMEAETTKQHTQGASNDI